MPSAISAPNGPNQTCFEACCILRLLLLTAKRPVTQTERRHEYFVFTGFTYRWICLCSNDDIVFRSYMGIITRDGHFVLFGSLIFLFMGSVAIHPRVASKPDSIDPTRSSRACNSTGSYLHFSHSGTP